MPLGVTNYASRSSSTSLRREAAMSVLSAEYRRRVRLEAALGTVADLLVIAAVYLMVTKPGL